MIKKVLKYSEKIILFSRKNKSSLTIVFVALATISVFYNTSLHNEVNNRFKDALKDVVSISAMNAAYASNVCQENLMFLDLLARGCLNCGNNCSQECINDSKEFNKLKIDDKKRLSNIQSSNDVFKENVEKYNKAISRNEIREILSRVFFYIFSAIIIIINLPDNGKKSKK